MDGGLDIVYCTDQKRKDSCRHARRVICMRSYPVMPDFFFPTWFATLAHHISQACDCIDTVKKGKEGPVSVRINTNAINLLRSRCVRALLGTSGLNNIRCSIYCSVGPGLYHDSTKPTQTASFRPQRCGLRSLLT